MSAPLSSHPVWSRLPVLLLLAASAFALLAERRDDSLSPYRHHAAVSGHGLALAQNLSFDTGLLLYHYTIVRDGKTEYHPYGRFPLPPFAMVRVAMECAGSDLGDRLYAARLSMIVFFLGALWFAFLLIRFLTGSPWRALGVVLLAGSTFYVQFYKDLVDHEMPALCGCLMLLWTIARWRAGEGKARWVFAAAVVAISLGWQATAVLVAWFLVTLLEWPGARRAGRPGMPKIPIAVGIVAGVVGAGWLGFNILNEYAVAGESTILSQAAMRMGLDARPVSWPYIGGLALYRLAASVMPYSLVPSLASGYEPPANPTTGQTALLAVLGILAVLTLIRLVRAKRAVRGTLAIMVLTSAVWILLLPRYFAPHDFTSVFMLCAVLVLHDALFAVVPRLLTPVVAAGAGALFVVSFLGARDFVTERADYMTKARHYTEARALTPPGARVHIDFATLVFDDTWYFMSGYTYAERADADYYWTASHRKRRYSLNNSPQGRLFVHVLRKDSPNNPAGAEKKKDGQ